MIDHDRLNRLRHTCRLMAVMVVITMVSPISFADDDPDRERMGVFSNLVGDWSHQVTLQPGRENSQQAFGESSSRLILGDRCLETRSYLELPDSRIEYTWIQTWDRGEKQYKSWMFLSDGRVMDMTGKWDRASETMTWTRTDEDQNILKIVAGAGNPAKPTLSITAGPKGNPVFEIAHDITAANDLDELESLPQDPPTGEHAVLKAHVGKWKTRFTIEPSPSLPEGSKGVADGKITWALGGLFIRETGQTTLRGKTVQRYAMTTYDQEAFLYRKWSFDSNGQNHTATTRWNAGTRTFTSRLDTLPSGMDSELSLTFSPDGLSHTGYVHLKDAEGNVVYSFTAEGQKLTN